MAKGERELLEHAQHNEAVCKMLHIQGGFEDWVVTTAYYSAIHYVKYYIFPLKIENKTFTNFDQYCGQRFPGGTDKHSKLCDLVEEHLNQFSERFKDLMHLCKDARYVNYKVDKKISDQAYNKTLIPLKQFCGRKNKKSI